MLKKIILWIAVVILIIALLLVLRLIGNPRNIANNGAEIREQLLTETPIGTPEGAVRVFISEHEHWEVLRGSPDRNEWIEDISNIGAGYRYGNVNINMETKNIEVRMEQQRAGIVSTEVSYAI